MTYFSNELLLHAPDWLDMYPSHLNHVAIKESPSEMGAYLY